MGASDLILKIFDSIFGTWVSSFFGATTGDETFSLLVEIFAYANIMAMLFAAIITSLFAFGGTVNAATSGTVMGERWSGAGSVISMVVAAGMVFPVNLSAFGGATAYHGQVSASQLLVLKLAKEGSDFCDEIY